MVRMLASIMALAAMAIQISAAPLPSNHEDSAIGDEVAVSAPNGIPISDLGELSSQSVGHAATSTVVHAVTTTAWAHETTPAPVAHVTSAAPAHETIKYGSGYNNWGGAGYDDCVQQCVAKYGQNPASYSMPAETHVPTATAAHGGVTHTVIVAPTQGVLRYVPWAVNASVGDTVRFMWGAGPHTVTKSSALQVCNKSQEVGAFASGQQNKSFVFDQVVNSTEPTFYYCAVPSHCQKGMFGVINPTLTTSGSPNSMGSVMSEWAKQDADVAAMWTYTDKKTKGTDAWEWGSNLDMTALPEDAYKFAMENTMYGRLFYGANPGMVEADKGAFAADGGSINIPQDISVALSQNSASSAAPQPTGTAGSTDGGVSLPQGPDSANSNTDSNTNGARSLVSSTVLVGAVAFAVSFLAL
ncbi:hypothetical protein FRC03_001199 [Tulasnella sp. 419]|nr:hypothetical protein FRC02_001281 [Tulasnella sp. 418]KAG8947074.1 hypothetical protein FRC03_001199 [Tulasnella sp. 419]